MDVLVYGSAEHTNPHETSHFLHAGTGLPTFAHAQPPREELMMKFAWGRAVCWIMPMDDAMYYARVDGEDWEYFEPGGES